MNFCQSIVAELWRPEVAWLGKMSKFLRFLEKRPITGKFSKFFSERIHRLTSRCVMFKFCEIRLMGNGYSRALFTWQKKTKSRLAFQLSLLRGSRPKSARASPRQYAQSGADFIQIDSLSVGFYPNAWTPFERAPKWMQYSAEAYLRAE